MPLKHQVVVSAVKRGSGLSGVRHPRTRLPGMHFKMLVCVTLKQIKRRSQSAPLKICNPHQMLATGKLVLHAEHA